ncbi:MAG TPA: serine/threonine-protein kinase, partial [Allocoleopsis sp.]
MSYCLNPDCNNPQNKLNDKFCIHCGTKILLGDRYRPLKIIGQGGFGRTFLAIDEAKPSQPKCVIKQFYPQAQGTDNVEKAKQLFEQEAIRLEELGTHDQIPNLLAYLTQDNRQYLVQQFINGNHLEDELKNTGKFSENQILELLKQLLPVLQYLHENKVIHRDIKPENIIINQEQKYILVDFGAAKLVTGQTLAKKGTVIGSEGFLAPEQARGKAIFASDIYSLGVTCIYLLTQIHPFQLIDSYEGKWVWKNYLTTPISDFLTKIIDKMIVEDYEERYQSVAEIIKDLSPITEPVNQQTWYCIKTLTGHNDLFAGIRTLAFTPDSTILASGSEDNTIKLWNLSTGNEMRTLTNHTHFIRSIIFTPDGKKLISASDDR